MGEPKVSKETLEFRLTEPAYSLDEHHMDALLDLRDARAEVERLRGDLHRKLGNQIGPEIFRHRELLCSSHSGKGTGLVCSECDRDCADERDTFRAERDEARAEVERLKAEAEDDDYNRAYGEQAWEAGFRFTLGWYGIWENGSQYIGALRTDIKTITLPIGFMGQDLDAIEDVEEGPNV